LIRESFLRAPLFQAAQQRRIDPHQIPVNGFLPSGRNPAALLLLPAGFAFSFLPGVSAISPAQDRSR